MTTTRRPLLRLLTLALGVIVVAALIAQARIVIQHEGGFYPGGEVPIGADLLVFFSAGRIVADGDGGKLYDPDRQLAEQVELLGIDRGLAIFPYPAFVALPYAALARISLPWVYTIVTAAMFAATIVTVLMLRTVSPVVRAKPLLIGLAMIVSQPFNMALLGGQTVAFSLICLTGVYVGFRRERDLFLGAWLGLLLYKPQLAALPLLIVLWQRRWHALAMTSAIGAALFGAGALAAGPGWPRRFLELATGDYYRENAIVADGVRSISIPAVIRYLVGDGAAQTAFAGLLCLGILIVAARAWGAITPSDARFPLLFGGTVAAMLLVSPHALFYEAGLLILPIIALVDRWALDQRVPRQVARRRLLALTGMVGLGFLWPFADAIRFEPLFFAPLIIGFVCWRLLQAPDVRSSTTVAPTVLTPSSAEFVREPTRDIA